MNVEIRLINLTNTQIQAICKMLRCENSATGIFTNSAIYKRTFKLKVSELSNNKKTDNENAYMSTGNNIRNTRAVSRKSCKENRRNVLDRMSGISKSCTRELARLKFSNAGPKMDIPRRLSLIHI